MQKRRVILWVAINPDTKFSFDRLTSHNLTTLWYTLTTTFCVRSKDPENHILTDSDKLTKFN